MAARAHQDGSRRPQEARMKPAPKRTKEGPKTPPRGHKDTPKGPRNDWTARAPDVHPAKREESTRAFSWILGASSWASGGHRSSQAPVGTKGFV
eukprot:2030565-Pyramimonas_sp.AAC.2